LSKSEESGNRFSKVDNIILKFMNEIQQQQQYYNMVNTSKMGDLDINLITLYARTPALYDKRNPFYKDKQYSERAWNDISMKLGYKGNNNKNNVNHLL
jgi:Alcohol dehydrogenase transcription factor Myb/SANT-like